MVSRMLRPCLPMKVRKAKNDREGLLRLTVPLNSCIIVRSEKMKWVDKITKKFAKSTSTAVKTEVKKTAVDLLPTVVGVVSMVVGIVIFKGTTSGKVTKPIKPSVTNTHVTTNNYFFQNLSEDMIRKIMEGK